MPFWNARARAAGLVLAWAVVGCGGGSGGGTHATTGMIVGTIVLPDEDFGRVAEREPNDSAAEAQVLSPLMPRSVVTVTGEEDSTGIALGAIDVKDAVRVFCHVAQDVTLTLTTSTGGLALGNLDVAAFDTATGNPLASAATASNPEVATFHLAADAAADVVVTCASGYGAYTLRIETQDPPPPPLTAALRAAPVATLSYEAVDYGLEAPACVGGRLLVKMREEGGDSAERAAHLAKGRFLRSTSSGSHIVEFEPRFRDAGGREALARAATLSRDPAVRWAEPDFLVQPMAVPNDPDYDRQWWLPAIGAPSAWDVTFGDPSVVVGIVDTGITAHPDLDSQTVPGYDFVSDPASGGDGNGRDPDPTDEGTGDELDGRSLWHGTHVAGIVAARANDHFGVCGVAPGCKVMMLRALGRGGGSVSDVADAIRYGAGLAGTASGPPLPAPLPILNLSLGTPSYSAELDQACTDAAAAGVLLVGATGNTGLGVLYPAAFPTVLAVGGVDSRLVRAGYSNQGPEIDLMAVGGIDVRDIDADGFADGVLSTAVDESRGDRRPGEAYLTGTSMAAAQVTGAAALLKSVDPTLTAAQIRFDLLSTAYDLDDLGFDVRTGSGLLRVGEAVRKALADKGTPRADPPRLLLSSTSLRFRDTETVQSVRVANAGGGVLSVGIAPLAVPDTGVGWLSAFCTLATPPTAANVAEVYVSVARAGLADGVYSGSVLIASGAVVLGSIRVVMEVGLTPQLEGATFQIVARDAVSGGVVASGFAYPWERYRYLLRDVPPGEYTLLAGTDFDGDGIFCETPDWCGTVPGPIHVHAGDLVTGQDVVLTH